MTLVHKWKIEKAITFILSQLDLHICVQWFSKFVVSGPFQTLKKITEDLKELLSMWIISIDFSHIRNLSK